MAYSSSPANDSLRSYDGAVVIVTGGASGIGAALGRALVGEGASVVLADRNGEAARQTAAALATQARGAGDVEATELDVRDASAVARVVGQVHGRCGRLDYLFNNAGIGVGAEVRDYDLDDWKDVIDVNLWGVIHGIQAAYALMIEQGYGHIVNTASMAGLFPAPYTVGYAATKHAVVGISRSLRAEARTYNVRVSALCPGVIRTPILKSGGDYGRTKMPVPSSLQSALFERLRPQDPDRFAAAVLRDVARNRSIIIHPRWWRLVDWLDRLSRPASEAMTHRQFVRTREEFRAATESADSDSRE